MSLRAALRNWLLKPSMAELSADPAAVQKAGELLWGHLRRDMERAGSEAEAIHVDVLKPGELE